MSDIAITRERIDELLRFLPELGTPGPHTEPQWSSVCPGPSGGFAIPYPTYPPVVSGFFKLAAQEWWSDKQYLRHEPDKLIGDDAAIASASLAQVKTMLTWCVRGERFCDGHWGAVVNDGRIGAILRRLAELRETVPGGEIT